MAAERPHLADTEKDTAAQQPEAPDGWEDFAEETGVEALDQAQQNLVFEYYNLQLEKTRAVGSLEKEASAEEKLDDFREKIDKLWEKKPERVEDTGQFFRHITDKFDRMRKYPHN